MKPTVWSYERAKRQGQSTSNWRRNLGQPRTANVHPSETASSWRRPDPSNMSNELTATLSTPPPPTKIVSRSSEPTVPLEEFQGKLPMANSESVPSTLPQDSCRERRSPGFSITKMMQHNPQIIILQSVLDDPCSLLETPPPTLPTAAPEYKGIRILGPPTPNSDVSSPEEFDLAANAESYRAHIGAWMDEDMENLSSGTMLCEEFDRLEMRMGTREFSATRIIIVSAQKKMKAILEYFDERMLMAKEGPEVEW